MSKNNTSTSDTADSKNAQSSETMTLKNFRSNGDIENFYRYIHDNGLRREAHILIDYVLSKFGKAKRGRRPKTLQ